MAKGLLSTEPVDGPEPANHSKSRGKGSLKSRILYRNQEIMMAKGLLAPESSPEPLPDLYRTKNHDGKGSLTAEPVDRNQQITGNHHDKGSLKRRNLYRNPGNHDSKGSLHRRKLYRNPRNHDGKGSL